MPRSCHPFFVIAPYVAPLFFPIGYTSFWVVAMHAFSATEQLVFRWLLVIALVVFAIAAGSILVCLLRGSSRQRMFALLAIPAFIPISLLGLVITYAILPRIYWV